VGFVPAISGREGCVTGESPFVPGIYGEQVVLFQAFSVKNGA